MRFFVGGLIPEIEDDDLRQHFRKYGEIEEASVIKERETGTSRKFGFVMLRHSDRVNDVLKDDHLIKGHAVTVKLHADSAGAASGDHDSRRGGDDAKKVFIGRLDPSVDKAKLHETFEKKFGRISELFLATSKKFGFITFEAASSAQAALALANMDFEGKGIIIKDADPQGSGGGGGGGGGGRARGRGRGRSRSRSRSPPRGSYGAPPPGYPGYPPAYGYPPPAYGYPGYPPPAYGYPPPAYGYPPPGYPPGYAYPPAYGYPPPGPSAAPGYSYPPAGYPPPAY